MKNIYGGQNTSALLDFYYIYIINVFLKYMLSV